MTRLRSHRRCTVRSQRLAQQTPPEDSVRIGPGASEKLPADMNFGEVLGIAINSKRLLLWC